VWGFKKLISEVPSDQHFVNKGMIVWHILAYFFAVPLVFLQAFFDYSRNPEEYEIFTCLMLGIFLFCTIILALIVESISKKAFSDAFRIETN